MFTPRNGRIFSWDSFLHMGTRFHKICKFRSRVGHQCRLCAYLLCLFQILGGVDTEGFHGHLPATAFSPPDVGQPPRCQGNTATFLESLREYGRSWKLLCYTAHVPQGSYEFCSSRVGGWVCLDRSNEGKITRGNDRRSRRTRSILSTNFV